MRSLLQISHFCIQIRHGCMEIAETILFSGTTKLTVVFSVFTMEIMFLKIPKVVGLSQNPGLTEPIAPAVPGDSKSCDFHNTCSPLLCTVQGF